MEQNMKQNGVADHNFANSKRLHEILALTVEHAFDGIYITDHTGTPVYLNTACEKIAGIMRNFANSTGMSDGGYLMKDCVELCMSQNSTTSLEGELKSGKRIAVTSVPVQDDSGRLRYVMSSIRDLSGITASVRLQNKQSEALQYGSEFIAVDQRSKELLELARRVARVDATVLIYGETGVGKEELAKYIVAHSMRANAPFVKINCGGIPEELIESELFGYEAGAFTGANREGKKGLFEVADGGVLLLDEIGELSANMQVKLLRFLQEKEIQKVGGVKSVKVDVRIIAATHRNLIAMVRDDTFRKDLYFRINIAPLSIAPLRERPDDIPPLVKMFTNRYNLEHGLNRVFTPSAIEKMVYYNWPGNVRELRNVVERTMILCSDDIIQDTDVPIQATAINQECVDGSFNEARQFSLKEYLQQIEYNHINKSYQRFENVRDAAANLGMNAATFVRKRKKYAQKYGLQTEDERSSDDENNQC